MTTDRLPAGTGHVPSRPDGRDPCDSVGATGTSDGPPRLGADAWSFLGIGGYNIACLLAGMGFGRLLDGWLGTVPALTLAGLALGVMVGVAGTWHRIRTFLAPR